MDKASQGKGKRKTTNLTQEVGEIMVFDRVGISCPARDTRRELLYSNPNLNISLRAYFKYLYITQFAW